MHKPHLLGTGTIDCLLRHFQEVLERVTMQLEQPISEIRVPLNECVGWVSACFAFSFTI